MQPRPVSIPKGTVVRVTTTNGGEVIATLSQNYYQTYGVTLTNNNHTWVIDSLRVKSIDPHTYPVGA